MKIFWRYTCLFVFCFNMYVPFVLSTYQNDHTMELELKNDAYKAYQRACYLEAFKYRKNQQEINFFLLMGAVLALNGLGMMFSHDDQMCPLV